MRAASDLPPRPVVLHTRRRRPEACWRAKSREAGRPLHPGDMALLRCWLLLCAGRLLGAVAQSVQSCGHDSDHLKNVQVALSPDPPVKGQPLTLTLIGTSDEPHTGGTLTADLQVKALDIIREQVRKTAEYTLSPALQAGPQKIIVGPLSLPSDLPGSLEVSGTVAIVDSSGEPFACLRLDVAVPVAVEQPPTLLGHEAKRAPTSCGTDADHLKNISVSSAGNTTTVTGNLDEGLTAVSVDLDLKLHALFVSIPLKMDVPISYSPGLPHGDFKVTLTTKSETQPESPPVKVSGEVKVEDSKGEEVTCIELEPTTAGTGAAIVV